MSRRLHLIELGGSRPEAIVGTPTDGATERDLHELHEFVRARDTYLRGLVDERAGARERAFGRYVESARLSRRFTLGYVSLDEESAILDDQSHGHPLDDLRPCATVADLLALRSAAQQVRVAEPLRRYIVELVAATRSAEGVTLGASPRASLTLMKVAQALALFDGAGFLTPEPVKEAAVAVIAHRISLDPQARFAGRSAEAVVQECLERVEPPV